MLSIPICFTMALLMRLYGTSLLDVYMLQIDPCVVQKTGVVNLVVGYYRLLGCIVEFDL